jgi:plasmid stabilization system protein ParE
VVRREGEAAGPNRLKVLVLRPQAEVESLTAAEWYRARSPVVASRFVEELEKTLAQVLAGPLAFPAVEGNARRARVRGFPRGRMP